VTHYDSFLATEWATGIDGFLSCLWKENGGGRKKCFYAQLQCLNGKSSFFGIMWKSQFSHQAIYITAYAKRIVHSVTPENFSFLFLNRDPHFCT
jgi:hypothetical protein